MHLGEGQARGDDRPSVEDGRDKREKLTHPLLLAIVPALILGSATYFAGARTGHVIGLGPAPAPTVTVTVTSGATTTGHGGGGATNPPGQELFHKTGVQLTGCYALSFTDTHLRPYQIPSCTFGSGDLSIDYEGYVQSMAQLAVYAGHAGFSLCQADTNYVSPGSFVNNNHQQLTDSTLCITTPNRLAVCYVTDDTTSAPTAPGLTMDVTVYALK